MVLVLRVVQVEAMNDSTWTPDSCGKSKENGINWPGTPWLAYLRYDSPPARGVRPAVEDLCERCLNEWGYIEPIHFDKFMLNQDEMQYAWDRMSPGARNLVGDLWPEFERPVNKVEAPKSDLHVSPCKFKAKARKNCLCGGLWTNL